MKKLLLIPILFAMVSCGKECTCVKCEKCGGCKCEVCKCENCKLPKCVCEKK